MGEGVGEPGQFVRVGGQQGAVDAAGVLGVLGRAQRDDGGVQGAQRCGEVVGQPQQPAAAAAVLAEGVAPGGGAVGGGEVLGEVVEVGDGGAAPAVDGLAGVADGGDRVAGAVAEQAGEQDALSDGGVLVLVEEDHAVLLAQRPADLGDVAGEGGGEGDLVAEVDEVAGAFAGPVLLDHVQQLPAPGGGLADAPQVGVGEGSGVEFGEEVAVEGAQPPGGTRCSASSPSRAMRSVTRVVKPLPGGSKDAGAARSTSAASWNRPASASSREAGSMPSRSPCSLRRRPAKAW